MNYFLIALLEAYDLGLLGRLYIEILLKLLTETGDEIATGDSSSACGTPTLSVDFLNTFEFC